MTALKIFLAGLIGSLGVQLIKLIIEAVVYKEFKHFAHTGGMPSSHASFVSAITTIIYLTEGLTTAFFISFTFGPIVIRDAVGVRRAVGEAIEVINTLSKKKVRLSYGHTKRQAFVGCVLGIIIALLVNLLPLSP